MPLESCLSVVVGETRPLIVALDQVEPEDAPRLGGKGANLAAMLAAGLPVPPGFCVTTEAFQQFVSSCRGLEPLWAALGTLGSDQIVDAQVLGAQLRERLAATPLPAAVEQAVVASLRARGAMRAYAVRSSATDEDQPSASFAGLGETFLNISGGEAILQSIRKCWISLFADRAILYRIQKRIDHRTAAMAVVVQELVCPDVSGVLFTADPVSGNTQRIVIEAVYGLGEALVSGKVTPDRLVLSRPDLQVIELHVGRKAIEVIPDGSDQVRQRDVDPRRARAACMDAAIARRLGRLAREVERLLGGPQDLEWAITGKRVSLLQSRPITTLARTTVQPQGVWSNVNSWEVLPGVLTPMTWSVASFQLQCLFDPLFRILGIDVQRQPIFGLIAGRAYANLNTLSHIARAVPGLDRLDFVEGLGGQEEGVLAGLIRQESDGDWRQRLRRAVRSLRFAVWCVVHAADQCGARVLADFRHRLDELTGIDLATKSETGLIEHLGEVLNLLKRFGPGAAASVAVAMVFVRLFFNFVKACLGKADDTIANRMLGGLSGLASAEAGLKLWRLAAWAGRQPTLRAAITETADFDSFRERLAGAAQQREFLTRWNEYMLCHGHHAFGEMDVHTPRWSETPDFVLAQLRRYLNDLPGADPQDFQRHLARQRTGLARDFRQQLRNPFQREFFDFLLRKAQMGIALRENVRNEIVRLLAAVRRTLLEVADRLTRRGTLAQRDDIFFVELSELQPLLAGAALGAKIATQRAEFTYHRTIMPPPIIVGTFDPAALPAKDNRLVTTVLHGLAASAGVVTGPARVVLHPQECQPVLPGEILIAPFTDPGWTPYFLTAAGIVMDVGGMLSHGSIVAREYGIPAVVNVGSATRCIHTGQIVRVDGDRGLVTVL
jgi:rifampicin phosphotransferase